MTAKRTHSILDRLVMELDRGLRTASNGPLHAERVSPAQAHTNKEMNAKDSQHAAGLMRINHCGEVCAQALYQGQALTARLGQVKQQMAQAAQEEEDHLAWCQQRLVELDSHTSVLNPLFYTASFGLGALAGLAGDRWSLGFVAETEKQVCRHLEDHLQRLPAEDDRSRAVLQQMHEDEAKHAQTALDAGGATLPTPVRFAMGVVAKLMTRTTYHL